MKKLMTIMMIMLVSVFTFTSCEDDTVKDDAMKFNVSINTLTKSTNGLVVKTTQADEDVVRVNTPACVKSLTVIGTSDSGVESKTFNFTPLRVNNAIIVTDNVRVNEAGGETLNMDFWGGSNTVSASTTSYAETVSMDPYGADQDGISSNVASIKGDNEGNTSIYGIDQDIKTAFFDAYPNVITSISPIYEDVKYMLRSIPPYAVFTGTMADQLLVTSNIKTNVADIDMTTNNGRMIITCRFDDGESTELKGINGDITTRTSIDIEGGYTAEFIPTFVGLSSGKGTCPNRTVSDYLQNEAAWFYWSNEDAVDGNSVDFIINIYDHDKVLVNTINLNHASLDLVGGQDIWVDLIIPEDAVKYKSQNININYNWGNTDRTIVVGQGQD